MPDSDPPGKKPNLMYAHQVIPQVTQSPPAPSVGSEVGIISVKSALHLEY